MKTWTCRTVIALVAAGLAGCGTLTSQPRFEETVVSPPVLAPDSAGVITAHVHDPNDIVSRVEGIVQEYERINLTFRDDGVPPDEVADDDIWTIQVGVPFEAPPGEFTLVITAYREQGLPVMIQPKGEDAQPMTATLPVVIRYPEETGIDAETVE